MLVWCYIWSAIHAWCDIPDVFWMLRFAGISSCEALVFVIYFMWVCTFACFLQGSSIQDSTSAQKWQSRYQQNHYKTPLHHSKSVDDPQLINRGGSRHHSYKSPNLVATHLLNHLFDEHAIFLSVKNIHCIVNYSSNDIIFRLISFIVTSWELRFINRGGSTTQRGISQTLCEPIFYITF